MTATNSLATDGSGSRRGELTSPIKIVAGAMLAAAAAALILVCVVQAVGDRLALTHPEAALKWGGPNPDALAALAAARFADTARPGHDAQARLYAAQALRRAPLNLDALRILALEAEKAEDDRTARELMRIGNRDSRRDLLTQLWLFGDATETRDWRGAGFHADALLRQQWQLAQTLFPVMILTLKQPPATSAFVERLGQRPGWRVPFLRSIAIADPSSASRVFASLRAGQAPPTEAEAAILIDQLIARDDFAGAHAEWLRSLSPAARPGADLVYNGAFQATPAPPPFNWRMASVDGGVAEFFQDTYGGASLHVQAPAVKTAPLAEQLLMLAPGAYRLAGEARVEGAAGGARFSWRITCAGAAQSLIGQADQASGPPGWAPFVTEFMVPPGDCAAQWLRLNGLAHDGFEPTQGWYRAIRVTPAAATAGGR
jgi:hypothetical protein